MFVVVACLPGSRIEIAYTIHGRLKTRELEKSGINCEVGFAGSGNVKWTLSIYKKTHE